MKTIYLNLSIVFFAILFSSCGKDSSLVQSQPNIKTSTVKLEMVESKVTGFVYDMEGNPLGGVKITFGIDEMISNDLGWFYLEGQGNNVSSLLKASKAGYFDAFPAFTPQSGVNKLDFRMEEKKLATTFDASNEYKYTHENGSVSFQKESIRYENGEIYTGDVNVYIQYFDPTSEILYEIMPGNLYAQDRGNQVVGLITYGMINVELESPSGEKLNLSKEALVRLKVPETILSNAPITIPLWHFDENSGLWQEDGKAILKDDYYEGTVSHFSFWNCDDPFPVIDLKFRLLVRSDFPMVNHFFYINDLDFDVKKYGYSDSEGRITAIVPKDHELSISIQEKCVSGYAVKNIGSLSDDTNLGDITIDFYSSLQVEISGRVEICEGINISNVRLFISSNQSVSFIEINGEGEFLQNFEYCPGEKYRLEVFSMDDFSFTIGEELSFGTGNQVVNISHCKSEEQVGSIRFKYENKWIEDMIFKSFRIIEMSENSALVGLVFYDKFITNDTVYYSMEIEEKVYSTFFTKVYKITMNYDYGNETYTRLFDFEALSNGQATNSIFDINGSGEFSIIELDKVTITDKTTGVSDNSGMFEIRALTN